jgi:hypothetical protein
MDDCIAGKTRERDQNSMGFPFLKRKTMKTSAMGFGCRRVFPGGGADLGDGAARGGSGRN